MRVVDKLSDLTEIESPNHTNLPRMRFLQHFAERVPSRRLMRASVMTFDLGRIMRRDAAHSEKKNVGRKVGQLLHQPLGIERGIGLAQVRLHEPEGFGHPPALWLVSG